MNRQFTVGFAGQLNRKAPPDGNVWVKTYREIQSRVNLPSRRESLAEKKNKPVNFFLYKNQKKYRRKKKCTSDNKLRVGHFQLGDNKRKIDCVSSIPYPGAWVLHKKKKQVTKPTPSTLFAWLATQRSLQCISKVKIAFTLHRSVLSRTKPKGWDLDNSGMSYHKRGDSLCYFLWMVSTKGAQKDASMHLSFAGSNFCHGSGLCDSWSPARFPQTIGNIIMGNY